MFRKRLAPAPAPAPPSSSPNRRNTEPKQDLPDSTYVDSPPVLENGMGKEKNIAGTSDDKAFSEVEHLLMQKTFTRVEFDRLTDLLRARTVESDLPASVVCPEKNNESITFDGIGGTTSNRVVDDSPTVKVPSHGASSPTKLAKQYMSSRCLREPQPSSLRSRLFIESKGESSNIAYDRRSGPPIVQAPVDFGNENPGLPMNGYVTPGLRGRSAIYRMSRSPYFKGPSSSRDVNISSQQTQSLHAGGRQVLKRRGADLENELGSIGPIRRIRQKSNLMSPFRDARASSRGHLASRPSGSDFTEDNMPIQESPSSKRLLLGTGQSVRSLEPLKNNADGKSSDNFPPIPAQSNKMAEKIFEQLNIIAPSPKEKQSRQQSITNDACNSMSKRPVLQDNGPNSMCDPTSSLKFQDLDGANGFVDPDLNGSLLMKDKQNLMKDGSLKVASPDKPTTLGNSVPAATSRKPGFKMAVIEDLPELDDDMEVPIPAKNSSSKIEIETTEQKFDSNINEQKIEQKISEQKVESNLMKKNVVDSPVSERHVASVSNISSSTGGLFSSNKLEKAAASHASADNTGFAFSNAIPGTCPGTSVSDPPLASVNDNKQIGTSNSIFGLKQSNTSDLEASTVKNKSIFGQSVTKPTALDGTSSERGDKRERAEDIIKSSDKVLPTAASTTLNAPLHFAFAASTSGLSNGLSSSSSPKPAVSSAPSTTIFDVPSSSPVFSSSSPTLNFATSASVGSPAAASVKSYCTTAELKPANTLSFGIGGAADSASKPSSNLVNSPMSSTTATFSSSPITSAPTFAPVAASSEATGPATTAPSNTSTTPSNTSSTAPSVPSASSAPFTFSSSRNSIFGFSSPAQSTGLSTTISGNTSQPSAAGTLFGGKPLQSEGTMPQPSQSSVAQFGSSFPAVSPGAGASSSGSGTLSFGVGASSTGSGTMSFGVGTSSSAPGTAALGAASSSSGPGIFSFGAGTSSSGSETTSFGVGAASSGPGTLSFGTGAASSGPGTVSFGATTSTSGPGFGNSLFGTGATFSSPFSSSSGTGFTFSSPSSASGSSTAASTSVFTGTSTAPSASTFSNLFGSSSSPSSTFTFGQSASSGSGSGFAFGAQSAPAFSSQPPVFSFSSANTGMNSATPHPAFGMANTNTAFGMGSPGNDQMNEDSMADDSNQAAPAPAPIFGSSPFGQQHSSPAAPVFGAPAPAVQPGGVFSFGSQQGSAQQNPSFPPAGSLEFPGGNFSLGSGGGGGDRSNRRMIKVKRTPKKR